MHKSPINKALQYCLCAISDGHDQHIILFPRLSHLHRTRTMEHISSNTPSCPGMVCGIPIVILLSNTGGMEQPSSISCGVGQGQCIQEPLGSHPMRHDFLATRPDTFSEWPWWWNWSIGRVACPITSITNFNSIDMSQRTRMNGIQNVGSKINKAQLKKYLNAFINQRKINVTSVLDMK